jgi:Protein of unknown function (DUF2934)
MASRRPTEPPRSTDLPKEIPNVIKADEKAPETAQARKKAAPRAKRVTTKSPPVPVTVSEDVRRAMIAEKAYLRAERRGFSSGGEEEDWLAAEAEVDALLKARYGGTQ